LSGGFSSFPEVELAGPPPISSSIHPTGDVSGEAPPSAENVRLGGVFQVLGKLGNKAGDRDRQLRA
jgi:hypothetical protein